MAKHYFRHFRLFDNNGRVLPRGGVTVYVRQSHDPDTFKLILTTTTSVCSHKDHYNKRIGRSIAFGRRRTDNEHIIWDIDPKKDVNSILRKIAVVALGQTKFKGEYANFDLVCRYKNTRLPNGHEEMIRRLETEACQPGGSLIAQLLRDKIGNK